MKIYFASDLHLGASALTNNKERELLFIKWLDIIKEDADQIFLMGDVFDFWFEYKQAVPKGFVRFLGRIAEISDSGIPIHLFTGNHDFWIFDYLSKECGIIIHRNTETLILNDKKFFLGHGDGLGAADRSYKILRKIFNNKFIQTCFSWIHPDIGIALARKWSSHSRLKNGNIEADNFRGEEGEHLILFSKDILKKEHFDFFIFGHRHIPSDIQIGNNSRYINLGDWISHFTYAVFDGDKLELKKFKE